MIISLSNLRDLRRDGDNPLNLRYSGTVDVTTKKGALWWAKRATEARPVAREFAGSWFFTDTGGYVPDFGMRDMERAAFFKLGWR